MSRPRTLDDVAGKQEPGAVAPPVAVPHGAALMPILLAGVIFAALSVYCAIKSQGFLEADACTHFQYARFALSEPYYFVNVWGRPIVTALYAIPAVLGGRLGVRITSLICALLIAMIAWRIAKDQKYRWPALAFIFTLAQPLVFLHSFSELTELPFALLLGLAFWAYCRRQWLVMTVLCALLPAARPEGFGFLILAGAVLILHRRWWWIFILPLGLLIWTYAGWRLYGSPIYSDSISRHLPDGMQWLMWLRHEWPYAEKSAYASGPLLHFVGLLPVIVSPLLLPFFAIGAWLSLTGAGKWWNLTTRSPREGQEVEIANRKSQIADARNQFFIAAIAMAILAGHSLLYWLGRMASNGELRYMLIVAPFWGLLSALGWEWTFTRFNWRHPLILAGAAALLPMGANAWYRIVPLHLTIDSEKARAIATWYRDSRYDIDYPRMLCCDPEIPYYLDVSFTDGGQMREWRKSTVAKAPPGTVLVWDPVYGRFNSDTSRVVTLDEIRAAGWIERDDLADAVNSLGGDRWYVFLSPKSIFGRNGLR